MSLHRRRLLVLSALAATSLGLPQRVRAQSYPTKPVRLIIPFGAGGPTDVFGRLAALKLSDLLGQQFFVENIVGASGNIGTLRAAKSPPDGYTMLLVPTNFVVNPALLPSTPYDAVKDFEPITVAVTSPMIISIHPSLPAQTVQELIALIKANPGKYSYASGGVGSPGHLVGEQFRVQLGLDLIHVPFQSAALAVQRTDPRPCRTCRQWRKPAIRTLKAKTGLHSWCRPERRRPSSRCCIARSSKSLRSPTSRRSLPPWASRRSAIRQTNSQRRSSANCRNGRRS
jgi:tripartite tricarboxylate transporter family receptor